MNSILISIKLYFLLFLWKYEYTNCHKNKTIGGKIVNPIINMKNKKEQLSNETTSNKLIAKDYNIKLEYNNNNKNEISYSFRKLNENEIICLKSDEISRKYSLCIECNTMEGYYPIYNKNKENNIYAEYVECYNENTKPNNTFFNNDLQVYEKCYESCETCFGYGDIYNNNCSSCKEGFIFNPGIINTKNCVKKCKYYYYYTLTGIYLCTEKYFCPNDARFVIEDLNKCVRDCKLEKDYRFQYNGECLKSCPDNTHPNQLNVCIDDNVDKCYFTKKFMKIDGKLLNNYIINNMIKRFIEEFSYTYNHFSQFVTQNYSILFYKNKSCLSLFHSNYTKIEFEGCIQKIKELYNIPSPLVCIFDRINQYNGLSTSIFFFHSITGEILNTQFCNNMAYKLNKNITNIHNDENYRQFIEHNIDIYDLNNEFYNSLCNNYNKIFKVDLILNNRILNYYPNITICDLNCIYKSTNYETKISICDCQYEQYNFLLINQNNIFDDEANFKNLILSAIILSIYKETLEVAKIAVIICIKISLYPKNFIENIGGIFILIILLIQIFCCYKLIKDKFLKKISKFINLIMALYIDNMKKKLLISSKKTQRFNYNYSFNNFKNNISPVGFENIQKCNSFPIKTTYKINYDNTVINELKNSNKNLPDEITDYSIINTENSFRISDNVNVKEFNKYINLKKKKVSIMELQSLKTIKFGKKDTINESYLKEYLTKSPDDLTFYKALKKDKRPFFIFLINMIIKKNLIIQTFVMVEETKPFFLKIILFTFNIVLFFFLNTILFTTSNINSLNGKKSIIFCAKLIILKVFSSIFINKLVKFCIGIFIFDKYKLMDMIKLEKNDEIILRKATIGLIKKTKIKFIIFIILNFLISTFSWILVSSFNFAYPNTKIFFFIMCILIIILENLFSAALVFVEACLRFISFKCKIKAIFTLSRYINEIN